MNMLDKNFETVEDGLKKLEGAVSLRNKMGGALYWNILNDDCLEIARKLTGMGAEYSAVHALLNIG